MRIHVCSVLLHMKVATFLRRIEADAFHPQTSHVLLSAPDHIMDDAIKVQRILNSTESRAKIDPKKTFQKILNCIDDLDE